MRRSPPTPHKWVKRGAKSFADTGEAKPLKNTTYCSLFTVFPAYLRRHSYSLDGNDKGLFFRHPAALECFQLTAQMVFQFVSLTYQKLSTAIEICPTPYTIRM
jgi:hypothetical protein